MVIESPLKLATPFTTDTVVVPFRAAPAVPELLVIAIVTEALELDTVLP